MPPSVQVPICWQRVTHLPPQPWFHAWELSLSLSPSSHAPTSLTTNVHAEVCPDHCPGPTPSPHLPLGQCLTLSDLSPCFSAALKPLSLAAARGRCPFLFQVLSWLTVWNSGLRSLAATPLPLSRGCVCAWGAAPVCLIRNFLDTERTRAAQRPSWPEPLLLLPFKFLAFPLATSSAPGLIELPTLRLLPIIVPWWGSCSRSQSRSGARLGWDLNLDPAYFQLLSAGASAEDGAVGALLWLLLRDRGLRQCEGGLPPLEPPFSYTWDGADPGSSVCLLCHEALVLLVGSVTLGRGGRWQKRPSLGNQWA